MKLVVLTLETIHLEMKMPLLKGSGSNQLFKFFAVWVTSVIVKCTSGETNNI